MLRGIFLIIVAFLFVISNSLAQTPGRMKAFKKMEELKKIKLIETLQMDEETSTKFFTRRAEHMRKMDDLNELNRQKIEQIESMLKEKKPKQESMLKKAVDEYLQTEENIVKERQNFLKSISELLSPEQMAKFVVFEEHFRNEISGLLLHRRMKQMRDN